MNCAGPGVRLMRCWPWQCAIRFERLTAPACREQKVRNVYRFLRIGPPPLHGRVEASQATTGLSPHLRSGMPLALSNPQERLRLPARAVSRRPQALPDYPWAAGRAPRHAAQRAHLTPPRARRPPGIAPRRPFSLSPHRLLRRPVRPVQPCTSCPAKSVALVSRINTTLPPRRDPLHA